MHRKAETETTDSTMKQQAAEASAKTRTDHSQSAHTEGELDFESLDLSIETVEERISPSETNVFDK